MDDVKHTYIAAVTDLEKDERIDAIKRNFIQQLMVESFYTDLSPEASERAHTVLNTLTSMNFRNKDDLTTIATLLLTTMVPELESCIGRIFEKAEREVAATRGVLVIYIGGTIGSAPKDPNDPESPLVVKCWSELKNAVPQLGLLPYPIDAISFIEPLDSCNVGPEQWRIIARIIERYYAEYEGFVILHGTDSMVYTASALSFMLLDLNKPVVLTGSQVNGIVSPRNDAHQNIITALMIAHPLANKLPVIPEVIVSFGNLICRGNRARKINVIGYQGFRSPNYPLLGEAGEFIKIETKHIRPIPQTDLQVLDKLDTNVIMLEVFPGMQNSPILANILSDTSLRGVILKAYGTGNIPTDRNFLQLFKTFIDNGGIVVVVTSVPKGETVMGLYETSQILLDRGLIGGFDITPEAAMAKLMMLLGQYGDDTETVKRLMQQSIAGEQRLSLYCTDLPGKVSLQVGTEAFKLPKSRLKSVVNFASIETIMLRFKSVQFSPGSCPMATIKIALDDGTDLGTYRRSKVPENILVKDSEVGESLTLDITRYREHFRLKIASLGPIRAKQTIGISVQLECADQAATFSWDGAELNIYTRT